MQEPIISVSGLRGIVGESLSPQLAIDFSCAFAAGLADGPVVVTRDGRSTGEMLSYAVMSGLSAVGRDVIHAGIAATPTTGVLVRTLNAAGGIQISASHNPPAYNGLKLFSSAGQVLSARLGDEVLRRFREEDVDWVDFQRLGSFRSCDDVTGHHLQRVLSLVDVPRIRAAGFSVLLDSNHGAGSILARQLLNELGCESKILGDEPDGYFSHPPEPTADNLATVCGEVTQHGAAVGFCQDPDADRLAVIDETGSYIGEEYTLALCLDHVLSSRPGPVVTNCATSRMAEDIAAKHGCTFFRSAVGEANVVDCMQAEHAVFGGEGNGGPIEPRVGYVRDSFVGIALILDAMAKRQLKPSQLASELPRYEIVKSTVELDRDQVSNALDRVVSSFSDAKPDRLDGLRLDWPDRWLLIRPSNTEPIVRVIAEAPERRMAEGLCEQARAVLATDEG